VWHEYTLLRFFSSDHSPITRAGEALDPKSEPTKPIAFNGNPSVFYGM
jgi:hypothetical protein